MEHLTTTLRVNHILKGTAYTYHIENVLGQGSFGITYLASTSISVPGPLGNIETKIQVAIKEFFMKEFSSRHEDGTITEMTGGSLVQNYSKKFRKEAENLAKLSHPNIVNVLEVFDANNTCYYAMQFIPGGSLDEYVKKRGGLPEDEAIECICQIGAAVQYMHDHRMLHLDLKPSNVMRSEDGKKMVLIDFGLSKQYEANGNPESSTTIGLGTLGYAPIEQSSADRDKDFTPTLDVYALGATFFKLLTGQTPPKASDVLNEGFPFEILHQKGVSRQSINAIESAMEPRKSKRLPDVNSFLSMLSGSPLNGGDETDIDVPKPAPKPKSVPPKPSFPVWLKCLLAAAVAAVLVVLGIRSLSGPIDSDDSVLPVGSRSGVYTVGNVSFRMIRVEGGTFQMGATSEQSSDAYSDESPVHGVTLSSFCIGETEVTQGLWEAVMGSNPSKWKGAGLPVEQVSWKDCQEFISRLNAKTGASFRLPTEAEWEYAARGGQKSVGYKYSGSDNISDVAWYDGNSGGQTHPVKGKKANELGIYDMSGNVWEWCQDWYGVYSGGSQTNPGGASSGSYRVFRGGSWNSNARSCRVSIRNFNSPVTRNYNLGLRLAL